MAGPRLLLVVLCTLCTCTMASVPEFLAPTPNLGQAQNITGYIGTEITMQFRMKASGINLDTTAEQEGYRPIIAPDEDPGMPNLANMSEPIDTVTEYLNSLNFTVLPPDFFSSRTFTWTPHCEQSYTYKVMFSGTNVQGQTTKAVQFNIMPPSPEIVAFENETIISRVGCPVTLSIDTREMDEVLRALDNPNYGQTISVSYSRTEPRGEVVSLDSIPGASFHLEPEPNEWQGLSAKVEWVPSRGQEAFDYTVCFHVSDPCGITSVQTVCRHITVEKCRICLYGGQTLQSVAAEYGTDYLSLYTANVNVPNPDSLSQGTLINTGLVYRVLDGDSLFAIASRFFTSVADIVSINPDLDKILSDGGDIQPDDRLCMLPPVCNIQCSSEMCSKTGQARLGIAEEL